MTMKYVHHSSVGFILWPRTDLLFHSHVADAVRLRARGHIVSAGFATIEDGKVCCYGESESLGMSSLPTDSSDLAKQLHLTPA